MDCTIKGQWQRKPNVETFRRCPTTQTSRSSMGHGADT